MIINSPYSSLYLGLKTNWLKSFDKDVSYYQIFAVGEEIRIQFTSYSEGFKAILTDESGTETDLGVDLIYTAPGDQRYLYEILYVPDKTGSFHLSITNGPDYTEAYFCVKNLEELENTVLLTYTHRKNEYEGIFINEDGTNKTFNFRVEGGIYPGDKIQAVENETFRDQRFSPYQISADTYEISVLTIGSAAGVPQWVGRKINQIFRLSNILVDGAEAVRNESSVPELVQIAERYPLYVFRLNIEISEQEITYGDFNYDFSNDFNII